MSKKDKKKSIPAAATQVTAGKVPRKQRHFEMTDGKPCWRFHLMDKAGKWPWANISIDQLNEVLARMAAFETMTPNEIKETGSHPLQVDEICSDARKRLEVLKLDDYEAIFSYRVKKKVRFHCIYQGSLMMVLWWDPEHSVWPVNIADN